MGSCNTDKIYSSREKILMKEIGQPTRNNLEGIGGWLNPSRYGWERISYWFQRLTGVFLLIYFIGHVYETSTIVNGQNAWESFLELTQTVWGHLEENTRGQKFPKLYNIDL